MRDLPHSDDIPRGTPGRPDTLRGKPRFHAWPGRPDGERLRGLPPGRAFMPYLVTRRCEAISLFEQEIDAGPALAHLGSLAAGDEAQPGFFALVLWALARALHEHPALNRYVMGRHIYQRRRVEITFSGRVSPRASAPVYLRKRVFEPGETPLEVGRGILVEVQRGRAGTSSGGDRLLRGFLQLPWPVGSLLMRFARALDHYNLLPPSWVLAHPLHASAFVANLGSLGIPGAYHPLYEHGAIPLALVVGAVPGSTEPECLDGRRPCSLKYSYDGRIAEAAECAHFAARVKALLEDPEVAALEAAEAAGTCRPAHPPTTPEVPCHEEDDASA